jgi:hypothetical protein
MRRNVMDQRDNLASMITEKMAEMSSGIDEKVNNAAVQAKVVLDLSSAVRVHLQKISEIANSGGDPVSIVDALKASVQNLNSALQNEESRVRTNYDSMVARKSVLQEVSSLIAEEVDSHKHWLQKKSEIQSRHLSGEDMTRSKKGQHPEKIRDVRNALEDLSVPHPEVPPAEHTSLATPMHNTTVEPEPEAQEPAIEPDTIYTNEEILDEAPGGQEVPAHVSRFFKDDTDSPDQDNGFED